MTVEVYTDGRWLVEAYFHTKVEARIYIRNSRFWDGFRRRVGYGQMMRSSALRRSNKHRDGLCVHCLTACPICGSQEPRDTASCPATTTDECHMMRERKAAGRTNHITVCPVHGA